jgi:hypothetical protein
MIKKILCFIFWHDFKIDYYTYCDSRSWILRRVMTCRRCGKKLIDIREYDQEGRRIS